MSMIGKALGHYSLSTLLGKGGIEEVYKAKDQNPGQDMAMKVPAEKYATDHGNVMRFQREAKLRASSNYSSIAGIPDPIHKSMSSKFIVLFLIVFILIGSTAFSEWWDEKPYIEWSVEQVDKILNDSPWVRLAPGAPPNTSWFPRSVTYVPLYFQVRLLTARPIRESLLRMISLETGSYVVDSNEINKNSKIEYGKERLQEFLRSNPEDVIVQGDDQHIIIAVTLKKALVDGSPVKYLELTSADELSNIDISTIEAETSLATNTGKRVALLGYAKPGGDQLGVKFYFLRNLADGRPLITGKDEELYFETRVNETKIKVKFDLGEMLYKGKIEF